MAQTRRVGEHNERAYLSAEVFALPWWGKIMATDPFVHPPLPVSPRLVMLTRMGSCRSATKMCSKQFGYRLLAIGYLLLPIFQKRDILLR